MFKIECLNCGKTVIFENGDYYYKDDIILSGSINSVVHDVYISCECRNEITLFSDIY